MSTLFLVLAVTGVILTLPGTAELVLVTLGNWIPKGGIDGDGDRVIRLAIVIPAHNEEVLLPQCLESLKAAKGDHVESTLVVVADNSTDQTAAIARDMGAHVLERFDDERRGKGYALAHAFDALADQGYDAFLVVDADSRVEPAFLLRMGAAFRGGADAVQCRYLVGNPEATVRTRLLNIALTAFNVVRPAGRDRFGLSAGIFGNGFGVSAATLEAVPYRAFSIVEDLEYHHQLVRAGKHVQFVNDTTVYSDMPVTASASSSQRARWEGGRINLIFTVLPKMLGEILRGRFRLIEPALELALLPLGFHVLLLAGMVLLPVRGAQLYAVAGLAIVALHVVTALIMSRAGWRGVAALAAAPFYVLWKVANLGRIGANARRDANWVRTEREP